jgi:hypothetical protein
MDCEVEAGADCVAMGLFDDLDIVIVAAQGSVLQRERDQL